MVKDTEKPSPPPGGSPFEIIKVENRLLAKVGGLPPLFDEAAVARAEAALEDLKPAFDGWLDGEIAQLETAAAAWQTKPADAALTRNLYAAAHDLRGAGATLGRPSIGAVAGSLCRLLNEATSSPLVGPLVLSHLDAVRRLRSEAEREGAGPLLHVLEQAVSEAIARQSRGSR